MSTLLFRALACAAAIAIVILGGKFAEFGREHKVVSTAQLVSSDIASRRWSTPPARMSMPATYTPQAALVSRAPTIGVTPRMQATADAMMGYPVSRDMNDLLLPQLRLSADNVRVRVRIISGVTQMSGVTQIADAAPRGE